MSRFLRILPVLLLSLVLINCPSTPKTPETVAAPTFTPTAAGNYQLIVTVTDSEGRQASDIVIVSVTP